MLPEGAAWTREWSAALRRPSLHPSGTSLSPAGQAWRPGAERGGDTPTEPGWEDTMWAHAGRVVGGQGGGRECLGEGEPGAGQGTDTQGGPARDDWVQPCTGARGWGCLCLPVLGTLAPRAPPHGPSADGPPCMERPSRPSFPFLPPDADSCQNQTLPPGSGLVWLDGPRSLPPQGGCGALNTDLPRELWADGRAGPGGRGRPHSSPPAPPLTEWIGTGR